MKNVIGEHIWHSKCINGGRHRGVFQLEFDWPAVAADVIALPADRSEKPVWRELDKTRQLRTREDARDWETRKLESETGAASYFYSRSYIIVRNRL